MQALTAYERESESESESGRARAWKRAGEMEMGGTCMGDGRAEESACRGRKRQQKTEKFVVTLY